MADFWARIRHQEDRKKYVLVRLEIEPDGDYSIKDGHVMESEYAKKKDEDAFDSDSFKAQLERHGFDVDEVVIQVEEALEAREREGIL